MSTPQLSSGDLIADRRATYAASLARDREHAAAAELMEQALELAPGWAAGWCLLGDYRKEAGDGPGAIAAYRELARLDVAGLFGAALRLAALGASPAPRGTEVGYVAALFDDYADRFEAELLVGLSYQAPERLAAMIRAELARRGVEQVGAALDLGCGTGLMGERLRRLVSFMEGVDLSAAMVATAARKALYDRVEQGELTAYLAGHGGGLDLVSAADVLNYCGELAPVVAAVAARLAPRGLFAFTVERHDGPEPMVLRPSLRYAHAPAAVVAACRDAGLEVAASETAAIRQERGEPLMGLLVVAQKPAANGMLDAEVPFPATVVRDIAS